MTVLTMTESKQPSSYRLSPECKQLIEKLAEHLGISQAGVLEQAVRKLARAEGLSDPPPAEGKKGKGKK